MLDFNRGKRFGKGVGDHVVRGAINKAQRALLDHPADPVVPHIDVLRVRVVLVIVRERDGRLIVGK
jgi:hypothetical protein